MKTALMVLLAISIYSGTSLATAKVSQKQSAAITASDDPNIPESPAGKKFADEKSKTDCARRAAGNAHAVEISLAGTTKNTGPLVRTSSGTANF